MSVEGNGGSREVREGFEPVALERAPGQRTPIDLGLSEVNGSFQPKSPLAPVSIPKRLGEGVGLPAAKVIVTPVDEHGNPLSGEGMLDGVSIFYGAIKSVQASVMDLDTIVKPSTFGLTIDQSLRSQRSPSKLFFKVSLPEGATLVQEDPGSGPVRVVVDGRPLVVIFTPSAEDAQGTSVPVSMSLDGDTLVLTVEHPPGAYAYPIMVDPRYEYYANEFTWDEQLNKNGTHPTNWHFEAEGSLFTDTENGVGQGWTVHISGSHGEHELGDMVYTTQKESHIWDFASETAQLENGTHVETLAKLEHKGAVEAQQTLSTEVSEPKWNDAQYCRTRETCPSGAKPENGNSAVYESVASGAGTGVAGENIMRKAEVAVQQEGNPEVKFDTTDETVDGHPNALYGTKTWLGPHSNALVKFTDSDKGIGIEGWSDEHTNSSGGWLSWSEKSMLSEGLCSGIQCPPEIVEYIGYSSALPDGEPKIGLDAWNALYGSHAKENEAESLRRQAVRVDSTPPHNITLSGLGPGGQIGAGEYALKAEATDGTGTTPSSGVKSIAIFIDGHEMGSPSGSCSPGPCTAKRTLTIFGHSYATGRHTIRIEATDNAGNTSSETFAMIVHPASPISLGPGSFNPQSGEYSMTSTDVSMGGGLTVSRSYSSEDPTAGVGGPLGAQWQISLGGQESLVKQSTGSYVLTDASGAQTIFAPNGSGGYISPAGDSNLELSSTPCEVGQTEFSLKNASADTTTCFKVPSGGSGEIWTPHITQGQVATDTVTYSYETVEVPLGSKKMVTRPHEALASVPAGVSCSPTLKAGCRALTFNYATSTTAKGEAPTEWGDIEGNLTRVYYTAWEPINKEMKKVEVAHYEYDKQGRLRTVWDPRIKPEPLKTYYGYDSEGHVTALTPPGQETVGIVYGTIAGSANPGAVLKVTQAPPATALWSGEGLTNTEVPKLTGGRTTGVRMAITEGKWSGNPVIYGYQWEDCNIEGRKCVPIVGATNANYTPTSKDEGARLAVIVTATNGSGSVSVTAYEPTSTPTYTSSFGSYGTGNGQLREPEGGLAVDRSGNVWVSDTENSRLEEFNSKGEFVRTVGSSGEGAGQFKTTYGVTVDSEGNVWATDEGNDRVEEFNSEGAFIRMFGWGVSNGESKLEVCTSSCRAGLRGSGNGEFNIPEGIVVDSSGDVFVADRGNHRVQEFNSELAWVRNMVQAEEHEGPFYLTLDANNDIWVAYSWDNKIGEFNSEGKLIRTWGTAGSEAGKLSDPYGIAVGPGGDIWVSEYGNNRVQVFTQAGEYLYGFGSKGNGAGEFNEGPHGLAFSGSYVYVLDSGTRTENTGNSRIEKWTLPTNTKLGVTSTQTIYYTTASNGKYPKCGEHPEWANMVCQTQPAEQPSTSGLPGLAVTSYTYNMYGEPTQVKSEVARAGGGTDTRTTTTAYDEAGRPETIETTSTVGTALPKVTDKYSPTTGALIEQSTSTESLKSEYNTLGQLTSYTDADGNMSTYEYEKEKDYRLQKMSDGKGTQTYEYDETTGDVKKLTDTQGADVLTFTAAYDVEGNMTSETYPNDMSANYTRNTAGETTGVEYVKAAHCAKTCPETWYSDVVVPSIHGQWITQQSNQAAQTYTYDEAGRLTQVLDNQAGEGCTTRIYTYEEESNRTSLTTRPPGTGGACATEGGTTETHTYDPADRLLDTGTEYDSFGNTTKLPAGDAGGTALTSTFYDDNQLASQTQGTQTISDELDPAGRTREIVSTGKTVATEIQHYSSPASSTPSWTGELAGNDTRYITGIGGGLVAIRHDEEKAILQLSNLHGDIIATAHKEETATTLESTIPEASEYGVPTTTKPPKYSWLGADEMPTTLPSGVIAMGARSYTPQLGRFLQTDPDPGGSANPYAYTNSDPVNQTDLSGDYVENDYVLGLGMEQNARAIEQEAAREAAIRKEAEERAREAAIKAEEEAEMAAELAEAEAHNQWDAEAAAGPPGSIAEGGIEEEEYNLHIISDGGVRGHCMTSKKTCEKKKQEEKAREKKEAGPPVDPCAEVGGIIGGVIGAAGGAYIGEGAGSYLGGAIGGAIGGAFGCS